MYALADTCIRRPVFATMMILAMIVAGAVAYTSLGVDRFPSVDLPTVSVRTELPGASPEEMEVQVSQPIEEAINATAGIVELRSISGSGSSIVIATFDLSRDIDTAAQDVRDRMAVVQRRLPIDVRPPTVSKFDNDSSPVLSFALSGPRSLRELTEIADKRVRVILERAEGVGEVRIDGGTERAIQVAIDADRLNAYGLSIVDVQQALARQQADVPGGFVTGDQREQTLRTMGRYADPKLFGDLVVATRSGVPIRISDVGRASDDVVEPRSMARLDGEPAVVLEVRRQSGANTIAVIEGVKSRLEAVRAILPADLKLEPIRDQSRYIRAALHEINVHLVLGSILATLVVLAFMRSLRATVVAAVAIPASVVTTFAVMWVFGFTLNSVTMLALVLMVGVVIDDAIVVLENIHRFVEEKGMNPFEAASKGTREIGLAVLATTLSLVVIFVPVSFMSSISGRFLYQFGLTAAAAIMVSLFVSFTLTPMMCARMLKPGALGGGHGAHADASDLTTRRPGLYGRVEHRYLRLLAFAMRHRIAVLLLSLATIATTIPLYGVVKQDYIPSDVDEAEFDVNVSGPEGASLYAMDAAMREIEAEIASMPQVRRVLATTGGGFLGGVSQGSIYVRIEPHEERRFSLGRLWSSLLDGDPAAAFRGNYTQREVMQELRGRLRKFRDLRFSVRNARAFNIGGGNFDVDFVIRGPDLVQLAAYGEELRQRAAKLGGLDDLDTTLRLDKPELRVEIDRARAAELGVETADIASALRILVGGDPEVARFRDPEIDDEYDVALRLREADRDDPSKLSTLLIPRRNGPPVRLENLVRIEESNTASRIDRLDRQRQVSLRGSVSPGFALGDRIAALRATAEAMNLPAGYTTTVSGRARELERTFAEFVIAFALSLVFMYMILASQFESLVHPLTILVSLPMSVPFALASLWATDNTLNLYSALGILVLFGVVKKNSILQIDHMNGLRATGMPRLQAILQANRDRLRPILMTTFALVAGMIPLAVGSGPGAEERRAIAVVVIGGQTLSLLLTLIATPVVYALLDDLRRSDQNPPPHEAH